MKQTSTYKYGEGEIGVFMPAIHPDKAKQCAETLTARAGIPCNVIVAVDHERKGFVAVINQLYRDSNYKYVVYTAEDSFPGINWLKIAYPELEKSGKGLFAFSDGKWFGRLAAFGMVRTRWVKSVYPEGILLWPEYESHYADNELTLIAQHHDQLSYHPHAMLIEVDYEKKMKWTSNTLDKEKFELRKKKVVP